MFVLRRLAAEPLFYFMLVGAGIYAGSYWLGGANDEQEILVDRDNLLSFIRQQSRDFAPGHAELRLDQADAQAKADLIAQFVREEALYREARALGYAQEDYVIRRRLVQRIELLAQGLATTNLRIDEATARAHYQANTEQYVVPDRLSFTHVFIADTTGATSHKETHAKVEAQQKLGELNLARVGQDQASAHGERFLYHLNYVDRTLDFVSSHFGAQFTRQLMSLTPSTLVWQGPLQSEHGWHLVLFTRHEPARLPGYERVSARVMTDLRHHRIRASSEALIEQTIDKYKVVNRLADNPGQIHP